MKTSPPSSLNLSELRQRLANSNGREYWRGLEELAQDASVTAWLHDEFPGLATELQTPLSRRDFLRLMGASLALAGLPACSGPKPGQFAPYVRQTPIEVPGRPLFFATAMPEDGYGMGVLVRSNEGRPTKVEGNPQHPASQGATDAYMQASVLQLWDPDRAQHIRQRGNVSTWDAFLGDLSSQMDSFKANKGAGLYFLTETVTSPTLVAQMQALQGMYPQARWHAWQPVCRDAVYQGAQMAFGRALEPHYRLDQAQVIFALDSDFFSDTPGKLRYAADFARHRKPQNGPLNRLYAVESTPGLTGAIADHRLAVRPSQVEMLARDLAARLGITGMTTGVQGEAATFIQQAAADLQRARGRSLVIAGPHLPPAVQALCHAMNGALGNLGKTLEFTAPIPAGPLQQVTSMQALVQDMRARRVRLLVILGGNPVYTAPADLDFAGALKQVPKTIHLSLYEDETARLCHWHLPQSHYLESWSDIRAYDGTASIIQPLIAPFYESRTAHDLLAAVMGQTGTSSYALVRATWQKQHPGADFDAWWKQILHDGVVPNTASPAVAVTAPRTVTMPPMARGGAGVEVTFRPDPTIWDGQYANLGWLQELPKPLTKLTWDNAACISPATAERYHLNNGDLIELGVHGGRVQAPVWILPGQADETIALTLGYGRTQAGQVGSNTGFNAYLLRTTAAPWFATGGSLRKTGGSYQLVSTQMHASMEGREIVRAATWAQFVRHPDFARGPTTGPTGKTIPINPAETLYPEFKYEGYKWAMVMDQNSCIGCSACVTACQAENNVPVVGKDQVSRGREMHWIRIDRYYKGPLQQPRTFFQPVTCMQCETAPCEPVCPVEASVHDSEGINVQVYNRCIGTRFCSNNCPYKVRRFNFYEYDRRDPQMVPARQNPEVTVRMRGVMEKCNYCLQRITNGRIAAEKENRRLKDGEVVPACSAACPTSAIVFGDLNDPHSQVRRLQQSPLNYALLSDLNTRPRTTYLARVTNPNPSLDTEPPHAV